MLGGMSEEQDAIGGNLHIDIMETPLMQVEWPTRMENFIAARALKTVGDLARLHPAALMTERNLGRKTIADTRVVLQPLLGISWEEAALGEVCSMPGEDVPRPLGWDALATLLPPQVLALPVTRTTIPLRLLNFAREQGLHTVLDLVSVPATELVKAANIGRRLVTDGMAALLNETAAPSLEVHASEWRSLLHGAIEALPGRERIVMQQRTGMLGSPATLKQIGQHFGVSRERIRQLEVQALEGFKLRAPWYEPLFVALSKQVPVFAQRLELATCEGHALVDVEADFETFRFVLEQVYEGRGLYAFQYEGERYWGRVNEETFGAAHRALQRVCETLVLPIRREGLQARLAAATELSEDALAPLFERVERFFIVSQGSVVGFGDSREDEVVAYLRAQGRPVPVLEIYENVRGRMPLPDAVVWLDRGLVTLAECIPDFAIWEARLGPVVCALLAEHEPDRQWTTAELLPLVATVADLPEWINAYSLGSLLRKAAGLVYLGRNVVALATSGESERAYIYEIVEEVLRAAGKPLVESTLVEGVRKTRGMADNTWALLRTRAPFLLLEGKRIGLYPRDVPGGDDAGATFCSAVFTWLESRDRGVATAELVRFASTLKTEITDPKLMRSLLRHDGRFLQARGGGLGLAAWGATRALTQKQVLAQMLQRSPSLRFEDVVHAVPTASGEPLPRAQVGLLARACGARLVGDVITLESAPAALVGDATQAAVIRVPERAEAALAQCMQAPRSRDVLRKALAAWRETLLLSEVATVDRPMVRALAIRARVLLDEPLRSEARDREVRAAVEYLVRVDDAECDTIVGGLDDDAAVLSAAEEG